MQKEEALFSVFFEPASDISSTNYQQLLHRLNSQVSNIANLYEKFLRIFFASENLPSSTIAS